MAHVGRLTRSVAWLTGPGDGSMGPSPKVMNNVYIYIDIYIHAYIDTLLNYSEPRLMDKGCCAEPPPGV
jgi:hypothetical protein